MPAALKHQLCPQKEEMIIINERHFIFVTFRDASDQLVWS